MSHYALIFNSLYRDQFLCYISGRSFALLVKGNFRMIKVSINN